MLSCSTKATSVTQLQSARHLWQYLKPQKAPAAPLDNFVELLLTCLGKLVRGVFEHLCAVYKPALKRDGDLVEMLGSVRSSFFSSNKNAGGLGKLMEQLLGAGG